MRRSRAGPTDIGAGEVQTNTCQFNYDKDTLPMGVEPGPWDASH